MATYRTAQKQYACAFCQEIIKKGDRHYSVDAPPNRQHFCNEECYGRSEWNDGPMGRSLGVDFDKGVEYRERRGR